jgi:hypothetical protein
VFLTVQLLELLPSDARHERAEHLLAILPVFCLLIHVLNLLQVLKSIQLPHKPVFGADSQLRALELVALVAKSRVWSYTCGPPWGLSEGCCTCWAAGGPQPPQPPCALPDVTRLWVSQMSAAGNGCRLSSEGGGLLWTA